MPVQIQMKTDHFEVAAGMTLRSALLKLDIPVESVLAVREDVLITDDEILKEGQIIRLVPVISGG